MSTFAITTQQAVLNHFLGKTAWTQPTLYLALFTTNPSTDAGASAVEASYTGYARLATTGTDWGSATSAKPSVSANTAALVFGTCTAGSATITGFGFYSASSGGTLLAWGTASLSVTTSSNNPPQFAIGALTVSLD
jgi:hypothetical protein